MFSLIFTFRDAEFSNGNNLYTCSRRDSRERYLPAGLSLLSTNEAGYKLTLCKWNYPRLPHSQTSFSIILWNVKILMECCGKWKNPKRMPGANVVETKACWFNTTARSTALSQTIDDENWKNTGHHSNHKFHHTLEKNSRSKCVSYAWSVWALIVLYAKSTRGSRLCSNGSIKRRAKTNHIL